MTEQEPSANNQLNNVGLHQTGSQENSEPVFLVVGKLRRPHGLRGEILMEIWTDFPERLQPNLKLYIGSQYKPARLLKSRKHQNMLLVTFEGYTDRETVGELRNQYVYVRTADIPPLPNGDYYHHQLIGLTMIDEAGNMVGKISEIIETGANDVFVVQTPIGPDILVPFLNSLLIKVDLDRQELHTRLLPGLLQDE